MRRPRSTRQAGICLALLLATACGSTVQAPQEVVHGGNGQSTDGLGPAPVAQGDGLGGEEDGLPDEGTATGTDPAGTGARPGGADASDGQSAGAANDPAQANAPTAGRPASPSHRSNPPGVTATTIKVGLLQATGGEAATRAAGVEGISYGDQKKIWHAVIDDINRSGGVLGRKLVPVFHPYDIASARSFDEIEQEACARWTQDDRVFAVAAILSDTGRQCLYNRGVQVVISEDINNNNYDTYRKFPGYIDLGSLNLDRMTKAEVRSLRRQGFFTQGAVVGVLTYDYITYRTAVIRSLLPELKAAGFPSKVTRYVHSAESTSDMAKTSSDIQNAVLRMRSDGVTHVLIIDGGGSLTTQFLNGAQAQNWYPRYGFTSMNAVQLNLDGGNIDATMLRGAMGIGYWPVLDLRAGDNPSDGPYSNPGRRECESLMKKNGIVSDNANARAVAFTICDQGKFLDAAITAGGPELSTRSFLAGAYAASATFSDAFTFSLRLSETQHDGVAEVIDWAFDESCSCMRYRGQPYSIP